MAVISAKESYPAGHPRENLVCFECNASVHGDDGTVVISGGYHAGNPDLFLCSRCARHSDLHILGYIIGDAIVSDYDANWGFIQFEVDKIIDRLKASLLRSIVHQQQLKLRQK